MKLYDNSTKDILLSPLKFPSYYTSFLFILPTVIAYIKGYYVIAGLFTAATVCSILHHRRMYKDRVYIDGIFKSDLVRQCDISFALALGVAFIVYFYDSTLLWIAAPFIIITYVIARFKEFDRFHTVNHILVIVFTTILLLEN